MRGSSTGNFLVKLSAFFVLCSVVMMRPMILGNDYSILGLGGLLFFTVFTAFHHPVRLGFPRLKLYLCILFCWSYFLVQAVLLQSTGMTQAINTYVTVLISSLCFTVLMGDAAVERQFVRCFTYVLCACEVSWCVSFVLSLFIGWERLLVAEFEYGYFIKGLFYFPITLAYNRSVVAGVPVVRLLAVFRESGIAQVFYAWAFFVADQYFRRRKARVLRWILGAGVICCFSTAGFIAFAAALVVSAGIQKKKMAAVLSTMGMVILIAYMIFYADGTSLVYKTTHMNASVSDRWAASGAGMAHLSGNLFFGIGAFTDTHIKDQGISLIAFSGQIGVVGLFFIAMIWIQGLMIARSKKRYFVALMPFCITALFAQPLVSAPVCYILFFFSYAENETRERKYQEKRIVKPQIVREIRRMPRRPRKPCQLDEIVFIAVCAVTAGCEDAQDIIRFANARTAWFQNFLPLEKGIPPQYALERYFSFIHPKALEKIFRETLEKIWKDGNGCKMPLSRKMLRWTREGARQGIYVIRMDLHPSGIRVNRIKNGGEEEVLEAAALLRALSLKGTVVVSDTARCMKREIALIRRKKADYILAVEESQPAIYDAIETYIERAWKEISDYPESSSLKEYDRRRREKIEYYLLPGPNDGGWKSDFPGMRFLGMTVSTRSIPYAKPAVEKKYYITSISSDILFFAKAVRERSFGTALDVVFKNNMYRKTCLRKNFGVLRRIALELVRQETIHGASEKTDLMPRR